jgi:hypothetical protein
VLHSRPGHSSANVTTELREWLEERAKLDLMLFRTMELAWQRRVHVAGCEPDPPPSQETLFVHSSR